MKMRWLLVCLLPCLLWGNTNAPTKTGERTKNAVLDEIPDVAALLPVAAVNQPHILMVNVGKALAADELREAAAYVRMKYGYNIAIRDEKKSFAVEAVKDVKSLSKRFGANAVIVVALIKQEQAPSFINIPGFFAQVNLRGLENDQPATLFRKKRTRQMLLKGLAHACGVGATIDNMCVMNANSFTWSGMDSVSATYGPNAYFSLQQFFGELGREGIIQW